MYIITLPVCVWPPLNNSWPVPIQNFEGICQIKEIELHVNRRRWILPGFKWVSSILQHHFLWGEIILIDYSWTINKTYCWRWNYWSLLWWRKYNVNRILCIILNWSFDIVVTRANKSQTKHALSLHKLHKIACCFTSWNMTYKATINYEDTIVKRVHQLSIFIQIIYDISLISEDCLPSSPSSWGRLETHWTKPERSLQSG